MLLPPPTAKTALMQNIPHSLTSLYLTSYYQPLMRSCALQIAFPLRLALLLTCPFYSHTPGIEHDSTTTRIRNILHRTILHSNVHTNVALVSECTSPTMPFLIPTDTLLRHNSTPYSKSPTRFTTPLSYKKYPLANTTCAPIHP